jgi:cephalosporin hydroxylase
MNPIKLFDLEMGKNIRKLRRNKNLKNLVLKFMIDSSKYKYSYNFDWLGRPIIQIPQDIIALQEIVWKKAGFNY